MLQKRIPKEEIRIGLLYSMGIAVGMPLMIGSFELLL